MVTPEYQPSKMQLHEQEGEKSLVRIVLGRGFAGISCVTIETAIYMQIGLTGLDFTSGCRHYESGV